MMVRFLCYKRYVGRFGNPFHFGVDARARNDMRMDEDVRNSDLVPERCKY